MREIAARPPAADELHGVRLVLRDGSAAAVRPARPGEWDTVVRARHFSNAHQAQTGAAASDDFPRRAGGLTLVATRRVDDSDAVIAAARYVPTTSDSANMAVVVDERFHGRGLGTLLLERLAAHAAASGFHRFHAAADAGNAAMLEVIRHSGFAIRTHMAGDRVEIDLSVTPPAGGVAAAERRRRMATVESLRPMLAPRAVALIGASQHAEKMGGRILHALQAAGFRGPIYPVHPTAATVEGLPAFPNARALPGPVDLAVIAVPPAGVESAVDDCAAAGVKALVIVTAGFAELGAEGRARQEALVSKVRACGLRMVGPNCMGLLNTDPAVQLNASFSPVFPEAGQVAFSSQSGALGIAILRLAAERGIGLSTFVSVGNKADVSSNDLLEYWEDDPHTQVVLLYLESFGNPRQFSRLARRIGRRKPIIALKAGRTRSGSRAAGSHTAALAASDVAVDALFHQCGVIRAETIDEMFDVAACLATEPLPRGPRVGIVTNAGGPGILAVDACDAAKLLVPEFSARTTAALRAFLPSTASVTNPVDMVASAGPQEYRAAIEAVLASDDIDAALIIYTPAEAARSRDIRAAIEDGIRRARAAGVTAKPVLACIMADDERHPVLAADHEQIPTYAFPENAVRALGRMCAYATWRARPAGLLWGFEDIALDKARAICRRALAARGDGWLTDTETWDVLEAFAMPTGAHRLAHTMDEAASLAASLGFPVAAKLASIKATHKSDLGLVRLNLGNAGEVRTAFAELASRGREAVGRDAIEGILIQSMVTGGIETLVGVAHDPVFGPLVAFGLGGTSVEVFGDVRFRVAPLTDQDADDLLRDIRGARLLTGYRGHAPTDLGALRDLLLRVSRLAEEVPEITELDLNPVMALPVGQGCQIVDARIRVAATVSSSPGGTSRYDTESDRD